MMNSGQVLSARFVLVRQLAQGTTADVWLAQDRELGGHVALKFLADRLAADPHFGAVLERECARAQALDHPHIIRIHGLHRDAGRLFIAMEYVGGGDLSKFRGRSPTDVLPVVIPVADALAQAHAAGTVHRDVKAANVLLALDGTPRLADFGLSLARAERPGPGVGAGSPYSMSPEQWDGAGAQPADDAYAFGVLLYELLTGYPPFYPDINAETVRTVAPAPLSLRLPDSVELTALVERCLAKQAAGRPTLAEIAAGLRAALTAERARAKPVRAAEVPQLRPPPALEVPLQPRWQRAAAADQPSPRELQREGFRKGLAAAGVLLLLGAGLFVFFVLPDRVTVPARPGVVAAPPPASPAQSALTPAELEALAVLKQQADDALAGIAPRIEALRARVVDQWGGNDWIALDAGLARAAEHYAARDYQAALSAYVAAVPALDVLEARAADVISETLARGTGALDAGNAAGATQAFELALKLSPGLAEATRGLRRAQSLDQVRALVSRAELAEQNGELSAAAAAFGEAAKLDPDARQATAGLARVQARISGDAFAAAMAAGFRALSARDYAAARSAFDRAAGVRPAAAELAGARQQLEQEEKTAQIATRLASARAHEAAERWRQALGDYQAVAALDATVAEAQQGIGRTSPRASLHDELQLYVTQPERLFSAPVRTTAAAALSRAEAVTSPGPVLAKQIATLSDWLQRVTVPVQVALESDNQTQVTIYRVGDLGLFTRKDVELTPGRYTVVGTRPGYRDVRREINIVPGAAPGPIVIRCEEKI